MFRPNSTMIVKDNGCRYHRDCFTCPYPDCIYINAQDNRTETTPESEAFKNYQNGLKRVKKKDNYKRREYRRQYVEKNKDKIKEYQKAYQKAYWQKIKQKKAEERAKRGAGSK